ncbi:MAG: hypothetical protein JKY54_10500 [Flavobacteriales bacterium]|nr:hypothetical protein [Flavobacteriales bacterium]
MDNMNSTPENSPTNTSIDVLLLCALNDEFNQVLAVTKGLHSEGWHKHHDPSGRIVADAAFIGTDGRILNIRATWLGHMGRESTQAVVSTLIQKTPAKCIAMSGICAGRRGKVELGDVIIADRLWSYDAGKSVTEDGVEIFQGDMIQYRPSEIMVQNMHNIKTPDDSPWLADRPLLPYEHQENWVLLRLLKGEDPIEHSDYAKCCPEWPQVLERLWKKKWVSETLEIEEAGKKHITRLSLLYPKGLPAPPEFKVHVAPLATGSVVKEDEFIFPQLAQSMRKVLGLDMEASGLAAFSEAHEITVVVAKAVSDYGDPFKDDRYREFAARASAETLISLLRSTSQLYLKEEKIQEHPVVDRPITDSTNTSDAQLTKELVEMLAELYPDVSEVRLLWERAGGSPREIENVPRPRDLWQRIWKRCTQGAVVSPQALLNEILVDYPSNAVISKHLDNL